MIIQLSNNIICNSSNIDNNSHYDGVTILFSEMCQNLSRIISMFQHSQQYLTDLSICVLTRTMTDLSEWNLLIIHHVTADIEYLYNDHV